MGATGHEMSHGGFFFFRFHLSMNHTHLVVRRRKGAGDTFKSVFKILVVHGFRFFDQGVDNIGLPANGQLLF